MIIPIRCFTCGKTIGNKWDIYLNLLSSGLSEGDSIDLLKLERFCCRRMFLSHIDLIEKILKKDGTE
jgi:DNA-directed RNA polymerase I, II, and III subunit RPABC5